MIEGYYYLHTNGALIYKRELGGTAADLRESDFVRAFWPFDHTDREGVWRILIEASSLGASPDRIRQLSQHWYCDDKDAEVYAKHAGVVLKKDGDAWCATRRDFIDLQESVAGFGETALEAFAELCKAVGYKGGKMWAASFMDLVNA